MGKKREQREKKEFRKTEKKGGREQEPTHDVIADNANGHLLAVQRLVQPMRQSHQTHLWRQSLHHVLHLHDDSLHVHCKLEPWGFSEQSRAVAKKQSRGHNKSDERFWV
jgi:hypothetical protein